MSETHKAVLDAPSPLVSEGAYALGARRSASASAVRAALRRIRAVRGLYGLYARVAVDLRLTVRSWISARRIRHDADARSAYRRQTRRALAMPALDLATDAESLRLLLAGQALEASASEQGLYIPPQDALRALLDSGSAGYPPDAALAIPSAALGAAAAAAGEAEAEYWFGQLLAAGERYTRGQGPRVYDLVGLGARGLPGYVVQHLSADAAGPDDAAIGPPDAARGPLAGEFGRLSPATSEALLAQVLDSQATRTLHFGRERMFGESRYLYQSIPTVGEPGRRDSARRWRQISSMLAEQDLSVRGRLVLDVGCNAGMMLACSLADGAAWGLGWDLPEVSERASALLGALGFTRLDLIGAGLSPEYQLQPSIPQHLRPQLDGSIVLYLAIRHHAGFVADLAALPWRALLYEGGESESVERLHEILAPLRERTDFTIASALDSRDGEGQARPLALLMR